MTLYKKSFGKLGEGLASNYLSDKGFEIVHKNYRSRYGEIDIIAWKDGKIHFIEVKTRASKLKGMPYEAVNFHKVNHLKKAAYWYVSQNKLHDRKLSLDVFSIILDDNEQIRDLKFFVGLDL